MQSVLLETPVGITARLGWDPKLPDHDRKRLLAKEIVSAKLGVEPTASTPSSSPRWGAPSCR